MQIFFMLAVLLLMLSSGAYFSYLFFQRERLQQLGCIFLIAGFVCQTLVIVWRFIISGHFPANNLHETLLVVALALVGVFLVLRVKIPVRILGTYAAPLAALIMLVAKIRQVAKEAAEKNGSPFGNNLSR